MSLQLVALYEAHCDGCGAVLTDGEGGSCFDLPDLPPWFVECSWMASPDGTMYACDECVSQLKHLCEMLGGEGER